MSFRPQRRVRFIAAEFDVAAKGNKRKAIIGCAVTPPEYARAEADRKRLDANPQKLGDDEMPEFMQHNGPRRE